MKQIASYPELIRSSRFWGYSLCTMLSTCAFYIFLAGIPLVTSQAFELTAIELGFYMGTITAGFAIGSFFSGRFSKKVPIDRMIIIGRFIACLGLTLGLFAFSLLKPSVLVLFGATIFVGIGNGISIPGASSGAMSVSPKLAGSASGLNGALTVAGGAVFTLLTSIILESYPLVTLLLGLMLTCVFLSLLCSIFLLVTVDRRMK